MADVQSPASPTSPTPSAPTHNRAKTIFQPSFNWRRLSLSVHSGGGPGLANSSMTAAGVKLRNLQDLTIFELLDTLKSLNCPLKARKCLQTVGVNGRDFEVSFGGGEGGEGGNGRALTSDSILVY